MYGNAQEHAHTFISIVHPPVSAYDSHSGACLSLLFWAHILPLSRHAAAEAPRWVYALSCLAVIVSVGRLFGLVQLLLGHRGAST